VKRHEEFQEQDYAEMIARHKRVLKEIKQEYQRIDAHFASTRKAAVEAALAAGESIAWESLPRATREELKSYGFSPPEQGAPHQERDEHGTVNRARSGGRVQRLRV